MSDIAPRPWALMGDAIVVDAPGFVRGRRVVGTMDDHIHIVACVNAIHAAGITPEALAADPECVRKLVAVSDWITGTAITIAQDKAKVVTSRSAIDDMKAALRACGIEVKP